MHPTRRTQPHRRDTGRVPSSALAAMLRGAPAFLPNPMDVQRQAIARQPGPHPSTPAPSFASSFWAYYQRG
jgi:hypothetical protein